MAQLSKGLRHEHGDLGLDARHAGKSCMPTCVSDPTSVDVRRFQELAGQPVCSKHDKLWVQCKTVSKNYMEST